jgi:hypothetical protein
LKNLVSHLDDGKGIILLARGVELACHFAQSNGGCLVVAFGRRGLGSIITHGSVACIHRHDCFEELTDHCEESLMMVDVAEKLWDEVAVLQEDCAPAPPNHVTMTSEFFC